jgi:hypothetical protein
MENKIFSDQQIALEEFVGVAHGAIEYVGAANYIERQHEAHEAVSKAANKFAADLAALRVENQRLRDALDAVRWEHEYAPESENANDSGFVVRCAYCEVLRDDVQSGADKHADGCKVAAALVR